VWLRLAGGQGTLGGLSSMAERVGELLDRATKQLALCSNDPICAEQGDGNEDYPLQGAACHACLLVPETSCESRNPDDDYAGTGGSSSHRCRRRDIRHHCDPY
jgi:hypothetical protein